MTTQEIIDELRRAGLAMRLGFNAEAAEIATGALAAIAELCRELANLHGGSVADTLNAQADNANESIANIGRVGLNDGPEAQAMLLCLGALVEELGNLDAVKLEGN